MPSGVTDGKAAVEAVERESFDLILMDVQMPEMDGLQATTVIRKLDEQAGTRHKIVALTARAMSDDRERCLAAGMDGYVSKPIRSSELNALIRHIQLDGRKHEHEESQRIQA